MSSPDIQTLISRSCLLNSDPNKKNSIDPDDFEHPSKLIKFLVGLKNHNEYFPLGGCWSESLDGPNPDTDPQVLIRTAIRCVRSQTDIDLSKCIQWYVNISRRLLRVSLRLFCSSSASFWIKKILFHFELDDRRATKKNSIVSIHL